MPTELQTKVPGNGYEVLRSSHGKAVTLDSHLVLNAMGRIAAKVYSVTGEDCEDLYILSDYLKSALQTTAQPLSTWAQEAQLLEHYLALAKMKYGLPMDFQINPQPVEPAQQVVPHSSCDALAEVLRAVRHEGIRLSRVQVRLAPQGLCVELTPTPDDATPPVRRKLFQSGLEAVRLPLPLQIHICT